MNAPAVSPPGQPHGITRGRRAVHARFALREAPGVTVESPGRGIRDTDAQGLLADAARDAAQRALSEAGRGYLGGRLELRTHGPARARAARDRRALRRAAGRAAALAVEATLRGDDTGVSVRATRR